MHILLLILLILLILLLLLALVTGFIGIKFSNQLLSPDHTRSFPLTVSSSNAQAITLPRTDDTIQRGLFGIVWNNGRDAAIVGDVTAETQDTVTRELQQITAPLAEHTMIDFRREVFLTPALRDTLGLAIQEIQIPGHLGSLPALYVAGTQDTWSILVHGLNDQLDSGLRFFQPLAQLGMPILEASYCNDLHAPPSPDGLLHLGDGEWHDVHAAAEYALQHGAQQLVIYGWSMGGAITEAFMHHSAYASKVRALILDAPVLDWHATLMLQTKKRHLPAIIARLVEFIATHRTGINFDHLNQLKQDQGQTPVLLFHGTDDDRTPYTVSAAFAEKHPDIVTFYPVNGANHVQSWNTNPEQYASQVKAFLIRTLHL